MSAGSLRVLCQDERALISNVFGEVIESGRVRIFAISFWPRAFVLGGDLMVWPAKTAWSDFAQAPVETQAVFIHEMVHVWQAQQGANLLIEKLRAGDRDESYTYHLSDDCGFADFNIEQQAMIVQHAFLAANARATPFKNQAYSRILAELDGSPFAKTQQV